MPYMAKTLDMLMRQCTYSTQQFSRHQLVAGGPEQHTLHLGLEKDGHRHTQGDQKSAGMR